MLLQDARSVQKLADQTLNNENAVTSENAEHLLEIMRQATAEELREKHEAELASERQAAAASLASERQVAETERQAAAASLERASSEMSRLSDQVTALQMREAQSLALREGQLQSVVRGVNRLALTIELVFLAILLALGVAGGVNFFTNYFNGHWVWSVILMLAGAASFARLVFGLLERPMPALATLLNKFCRSRAHKKLTEIWDWPVKRRGSNTRRGASF